MKMISFQIGFFGTDSFGPNIGIQDIMDTLQRPEFTQVMNLA
jgi:hypothetical protein